MSWKNQQLCWWKHRKDIAAEIYQLHILLEQAGIRKGDRVALLGRNSSRWVISFFGILSYGAVATPILHDFKPENVHHIVNHSESKVLLAAKQNWEVLNEQAIAEVELILSLEDWSVIRSKRPELSARTGRSGRSARKSRYRFPSR